jgi:glycosyltransferase involved in cell wall biosynthesis
MKKPRISPRYVDASLSSRYTEIMGPDDTDRTADNCPGPTREPGNRGGTACPVSVVIPTLNEERAIGEVLSGIPAPIWRAGEVLVVDASRDRTPLIAGSLGARVIPASCRGKGHQVKLGMDSARGDILVMMDGDGEHPPEYIPLLVAALESGCDMSLGTRMRVPFADHPVASIIYFLYLPVITGVFRLAGVRFSGTPLTGYRCMRREAWETLRPESGNFLFEAEMNVKMGEQGVRYREVSIPFRKRSGGLARSRVLLAGEGRAVVGFILGYMFRRRIRGPFTEKIDWMKGELVHSIKLFVLELISHLSIN